LLRQLAGNVKGREKSALYNNGCQAWDGRHRPYTFDLLEARADRCSSSQPQRLLVVLPVRQHHAIRCHHLQ